jgi:formylglycine-generating enzyme required for sulfatase activity
VRSSDAVIVCLSRSSVTKAGYIQKEINQILDLADEQPQDTIFVIPLKLEECEIPARISRWQWVNFFDERGFERLLRSLYNRAENVGAALVSSRQPANVKASARETVVSHEDPNILIDPATGLMWTRRHNNEDINWIKASEYAKNLSLGGYADWRLPTIEELERLSDPQRGHGFKIREPFKLEKPRIWSSTKKDSDSALYFDFFVKGRGSSPVEVLAFYRALCVRRSGKPRRSSLRQPSRRLRTR